MLEGLKKIFQSKKPDPLIIRFEDIPVYLDKRNHAITGILQKDADIPMQTIRAAVHDLGHIVQMLHAAEFNTGIHPKLKSIAKNTLPQYAKAMETALSKPLPDDVEEFYTAATEILKVCINSSHSQGKYLQTVFPEEMKSVRTGIDAIGREINTMTRSLAAYRKELAFIKEAEKTHRAVVDIYTDTEKSHTKENRIVQRITEIQNRIETCRQEIQSLETDDAQHTISEQKRDLEILTKERERIVRRYAVLSMTAAHVLRKAEKIAVKQHNTQDAVVLQHSLDLLSDHTIPDISDLTSSLSSACSVAERMIGKGEVVLKNKEERALFSDTAGFVTEISALSKGYAEQAQQCDAAEQTLRVHPIIVRSQNLVREKNQLEIVLKKEIQSRVELANWRNDLEKSIPSLQQSLEKTLRDLSGSDVQLQYPMTIASSP
ncbi:MAG: hypothetical protein OS112_07775 [Methanoregula sp.]|nr:MAG: hypothetical protein OS112_07775 [Methanoregula sp.]